MKLPEHKYGLYLEHNVHRDCGMPVKRWIVEDLEQDGDQSVWVSAEERAGAIACDEVWTLQWYADSPLGFYKLAASSLEVLLEAAAMVS